MAAVDIDGMRFRLVAAGIEPTRENCVAMMSVALKALFASAMSAVEVEHVAKQARKTVEHFVRQRCRRLGN